MKTLLNRISAFVLCLTNIFTSHAQYEERIYDIIELQDGSVLAGYISSQNMDEGVLSFHSKVSRLVLPSSVTRYREDKTTVYTELNNGWKGYYLQSHIKQFNPDSSLVLTSLRFPELTKDDKSFILLNQIEVLEDVHVAEEGFRWIVDCVEPLDFQIESKAINEMHKSELPPLLLNGVKDIVFCEDESPIEGQIIEQIPAHLLVVKDCEGKRISLPYDKIIKIERKKIDSKLSFGEQSPLLETIKLNNKQEYQGVIVRQMPREGLLFINTGDSEVEIKLADIKEINKSNNQDYFASIDREIHKDSVYLGSSPLVFLDIEESKDDIFSISSESICYLDDSPQDGKINVFVNGEDERFSNPYKVQIVKVNRPDKSKKLEFNFKMKDLFTRGITVESTKETLFGTRILEFPIEEKGIYLLIVPDLKSGALFSIE